VEKVKIFQRNPEGVVVVIFKEHEDAAQAVIDFSGRWFGGKQVESDFYDGWSNYEVEETEEQKNSRLKAFEEWIESQDCDNNNI